MSSWQTATGFSAEEYLAQERKSDKRHEYFDGEILGMAEEGLEHATIRTNLVGLVGTQLLGTPCQAFFHDMKVLCGSVTQQEGSNQNLIAYPDMVVVCGELKFHDEHRHVILNPTVIIEVSSPYTETFDRREKWSRYQTCLLTLKDYLMVAQSQPQIE